MKIIKDYKVEILKQEFENDCLIEYSIRRGNATIVSDKLEKINKVKVNYISTI